MKRLLFYLSLILLSTSNDVQTNPGPDSSTIYPCGTCDERVTWDHRAIVCDSCDQWYHIDCQGVHTGTYDDLAENSAVRWDCIICGEPNYSLSCYDLSGLETSNTFSCLSDLSSYSSILSPDPVSAPPKPLHSSTPSRPNNEKKKQHKPLRVMNVNFQSIRNKKAQLDNMIDSLKPDVIIGTETWLDPSVASSESFPDSFKVYRRDRIGQEGGGVLVAVKNDLLSEEVPELQTNCEMIWVKINTVKNKCLYLCSFYNPHTDNEESLANLGESLRRTNSLNNANIIVAGDFNLPGWDWKNRILKPNTNYPGLHYHFLDTLDDCGLTQIVEQPTRGENTLDLVCTNHPNQILRQEVTPGLSDHDAVFFEIDLVPMRFKQKPRHIPLYKKAKWDSLRADILRLGDDIETLKESSSAEDLWALFKNTLEKGVKDHIPHKIAKIKDGFPWITPDIRKLLRKKDRLYKMKKKSGDRKITEKYKSLKHKIQKLLRQAYWSYVEDIITPTVEEDNQSCMKKFWTFIKHKRTDRSGIASLKQEGQLCADPVGKATILNSQFQSVFSKNEKVSAPEFQNTCKMTKPDTPYPIISTIEISGNGVEKILKNLDPHKAAGPDSMKPKVLKELSSEIAPILTIIFQKSLDTGVVPSDWKRAHVAPIYKKGPKFKPENYRPISLTCICCKIMEHIVASNIMSHAEKNDILYPLQHGFRKQRSCETQLIEFTDNITTNMQAGQQTDILVMDFSKAFDKVSHSLLTHKLEHYGIHGNINTWIANFLSDRSQAVLVDGEMSDYLSVESGVPQGSVLGPCLFLYYINDIPDGLQSTVRLFADDTIAYLTVCSEADASVLQRDLDLLAIWEQKWKMEFHPDKCNILTISRRRNPLHFDYSLHGHVLARVPSAKYLGITFTDDLRWDTHVSNICDKANNTLGFLRRNLKVGSPTIKEKAYFSLVRPSLEYACSAWDPYTKCDIDRLEMVQRRAARYVTNMYRRTTSVGELLHQLNWRSLQDRRRDIRLTMLYKIKNELVAIPNNNRLRPPHRISRHAHENSLQIPSCKANYKKFSFFPHTITEWNSLDPAITSSDSLEQFKSSLKNSH